MVQGYTVPLTLCLTYMVVRGYLQVQAAFLTRVDGKKGKGRPRTGHEGSEGEDNI
jgi:hypothetical protein